MYRYNYGLAIQRIPTNAITTPSIPTSIMTPSMLMNVRSEIAESVDMQAGIEQFNNVEREKIKYALDTGDFSDLTPNQKAWVNAQVLAKQEEIQQNLTEEEALAMQQALAAQQQLEEEKRRSSEIAMQKTKQYTIYGAVVLAGLGLIYFLSKR